MNDIRRVLRVAAVRLFITDLGRWFIVALAGALLGAIVLRIAQQVVGLAVAWGDVAMWGGIGVGVATVVMAIVTRRDRAAVARRVDEGADLRETISTALCVAHAEDPWSRATVESASARAREVEVRKAIPVTAPRSWPVPLALALAFAVVWLALPRVDVFGRIARIEEKKEQDSAVAEAKAQVDAAKEKVEQVLAKLNLPDPAAAEAQLASLDAKTPEKPMTPEEIRRSAIKDLTAARDRVEQMKAGQQSTDLEALRDKLAQIRTPGKGPLSELANELGRGNFVKASEELAKLAEQLASGKMSPEDSAKLQEQLDKMAEQLKALAADQKGLEDALAAAGLPKDLAKQLLSNPEALKQAIQNAQNLTDEQKQQLQQLAKANQNASQQCEGLGGQCSQLSQGMSEQGMSGEGLDALGDMMGQLSQMEMLQDMMSGAEAAGAEVSAQLAALSGFCESGMPGMGACEGGLAQGEGTQPWSSGWSQDQGNGSGGPGIGRGGSPGAQRADYQLNREKIASKTQQGPIIGSMLIEGESIKGESVASFAAAVATADQEAAEAIESNVIPREYRDAVKHYFGRLQAKARAAELGEGEGEKPAESDDK